MTWKKLLLIAVAVLAFGFAAAPRSEASGLSVGIGFGVPGGYGCGYGGYGYGGGYYGRGYGYSSHYGRSYYAPVRVVIRPHYHWRHGRRFYCTERHRRWR